MQRHWGKLVVGALIVVLLGAGAVFAIKWFWPGAATRQPNLVQIPPLPPVSRSSRIVLPAAIAMTAIRDAMERAPRELSGKPETPFGPPGSNMELVYQVTRGGFAVAGRPEGLFLSTSLAGSLRLTGQFGPPGGGGGFGPPGGFGGPPPGFGPPGGFFRGNQGQSSAQNENDRRIDVRGNLELTARPELLAGWRVVPNLVSQVTIGDASISVFGMTINLSNEMKPMLERTINEQISSLQKQLADSSMVEEEAKKQWAQMCRSISLGATAPGAPNLWLELRPTRAFAAQPRIDQSAVTLTFGVQADTRIVPTETKPDCPFPAQLELVQQMEQGQFNIALPIDIPFTEISRVMETQLKGKVFPEDRSGSFTATIQSVNVAASGDRLLISLGVKANETKSWFGFGASAVIHVWGRPRLDRDRQIMRIEDIQVDIDSEAAFGLLGLAARAAVPYLERALADNSTVDLAQFATNARRSIDAAIADFQRTSSGVRVDATATDLRLVGLEFDSKVLRVIGEADGTVRVAVTALPAQ
jgi:hypothetical protein